MPEDKDIEESNINEFCNPIVKFIDGEIANNKEIEKLLESGIVIRLDVKKGETQTYFYKEIHEEVKKDGEIPAGSINSDKS